MYIYMCVYQTSKCLQRIQEDSRGEDQQALPASSVHTLPARMSSLLS